MNLTERGKIERALPPIWKNGAYSPARIEFYVTMCYAEAPHLDGKDLAEFLAAMLLESGLDNLGVGNNALNGSDNVYIGATWVQRDTGWHFSSLDDFHYGRADPINSFAYVLTTPDLSHTSRNRVWFNKQRWNAWWDHDRNRVDWERLDPVDSWSPYATCLEAVRALT